MREADRIIGAEVTEAIATQGIELQKHAQAAKQIAKKCNDIARSTLSILETKDRMLEARVNSGTADMMQIAHAQEQGAMFIAEELARINSNISAIDDVVAAEAEMRGREVMNRAQEAAAYSALEKENIERGNRYMRQQDSKSRINRVFRNCRGFK